jgi:D-aspartate ligase
MVGKAVPVIICGDNITSYGVIRGLKERKVPIYIIAQKPMGVASKSRYVNKSIILPSTDLDFISKLNIFIENEINANLCLLIVSDDLYLDILSKNIEKLSRKVIPTFPEWEIVQKVRKKKTTFSIAKNLNIPIPQTLMFSSKEELNSIIEGAADFALNFPIIIKAECSKEMIELFKVKVMVANNFNELIKYLKACDSLINSCIIQEMIPGGEEKLYCLKTIFNRESKPLAVFVDKKIRSWGKFSPCSLTKTDWADQVVSDGLKLLQNIGYYGYASVEFKFDDRDGLFKLMEINGRISMNNSHALLSGINLPSILYNEALNGPLKGLEEIKPLINKDGIWWYPKADLINLYQAFLNHNIKSFFKPLNFKKCIIEPLILSDPYPFLYEMALLFKSLLGKLLRGFKR